MRLSDLVIVLSLSELLLSSLLYGETTEKRRVTSRCFDSIAAADGYQWSLPYVRITQQYD